MNYIYWTPHSKEAEFYRLLLNYDSSMEVDLADCRIIQYESWTKNLMVWDYWIPGRIASKIISKYYGFIEWLVETDKVDLDQIAEIWYWNEVEWVRWYSSYNVENALLMLLSIQDEPIKFLISILK